MRHVIMVLIITCLSCGRVPVTSDLSTSITAAAAKGDGTTIDLDALADFEWDQVCILGPFMRPADISRNLGFHWKGKRSGARGSLVFVDVRSPRSDSSATGYLPIRGNQWFIEGTGCIPRSKSTLLVRLGANGLTTLIPMHSTHGAEPPSPFR